MHYASHARINDIAGRMCVSCASLVGPLLHITRTFTEAEGELFILGILLWHTSQLAQI